MQVHPGTNFLGPLIKVSELFDYILQCNMFFWGGGVCCDCDCEVDVGRASERRASEWLKAINGLSVGVLSLINTAPEACQEHHRIGLEFGQLGDYHVCSVRVEM
jgi:hypothetical protein